MSAAIPLSGKDLKLLKVPALVLAFCIALALAASYTASHYDRAATAGINQARAGLTQVRDSIEQISAEEATIERYIERYHAIEADGSLGHANRLAFLENIGQSRQNLKLFPVSVDIGNQFSTPLSYSAEDPMPGDPLALNASVINLRLGLLHELDLVRLLDAIDALPGLYQATKCRLGMASDHDDGFEMAVENLVSECSFNWYSFDLAPEPATEEYY